MIWYGQPPVVALRDGLKEAGMACHAPTDAVAKFLDPAPASVSAPPISGLSELRGRGPLNHPLDPCRGNNTRQAAKPHRVVRNCAIWPASRRAAARARCAPPHEDG